MRTVTLAAELTWTGKKFERGVTLTLDPKSGNVSALDRPAALPAKALRLPGRALLPGMVNAHSHSFQRVIRGRAESRTPDATRDSFWTWREQMYHAVLRLTPEDIYDASRMVFLEMALAGITAVGEFHYVHHTPEGRSYAEPLATAQAVAQAAREVGVRITVLFAGYARGGFRRDLHPAQLRFVTREPADLCARADAFSAAAARGNQDEAPLVRTGLAPHSLRAVSLSYATTLHAAAAARQWPLHIHVSEQPGENDEVVAEHGVTPTTVLSRANLLDSNLTAIHAVHLSDEEYALFGGAHANVCACPLTERNLGDGVVRADLLLARGASVALGTDSQIEIDLLAEARALESHLRLVRLERAALAPFGNPDPSALAARLLDCATDGGARALRLDPGAKRGDWFTVDLDDPALAGADETTLLPTLFFAGGRSAVRDVWIAGRPVVRDGAHPLRETIISRFTALQRRLWS